GPIALPLAAQDEGPVLFDVPEGTGQALPRRRHEGHRVTGQLLRRLTILEENHALDGVRLVGVAGAAGRGQQCPRKRRPSWRARAASRSVQGESDNLPVVTVGQAPQVNRVDVHRNGVDGAVTEDELANPWVVAPEDGCPVRAGVGGERGDRPDGPYAQAGLGIARRTSATPSGR